MQEAGRNRYYIDFAKKHFVLEDYSMFVCLFVSSRLKLVQFIHIGNGQSCVNNVTIPIMRLRDIYIWVEE